MKQEKLISLASAIGWFCAYIFVGTITIILPDAIDTLAVLIALWGLVMLSANLFEGKHGFLDLLSHGGIRAVSPELPLYALLMGAALNLIVGSAISLLPLPDSVVGNYNDASEYLGVLDIWLIIDVSLFVPMLEETIYRGLIADRLGRVFPKPVAIIAASAIFAVMHVDPLWMGYAFVLGLIINGIYFRTNSILPCFALHFAFNFSNYCWDYILFPLPNEKWAHVLVLFVSVAVFAVFALLTVKRTKKKDGEGENV